MRSAWISTSRLDVRGVTAVIILCIVILFYVLLSQYNPIIFDVPHPSIALHRFVDSYSSLHHNKSSSIAIPLQLTDRGQSPYVVVGFCCHTHDGVDAECDPQPFVIAIAEGTFSSTTKQIEYQQCTKKGTAPSFISNWIRPDILLCQGYFYDDDLITERAERSGADRLKIDIESQMTLYHHLDVPYDVDNYNIDSIEYNENLKYSIRLSRRDPFLWSHYNRPFLTTYNTEFWGGGQCHRYDLIFESVFDRTLHGCVTVYIPPAFFFESERIWNRTEQLVVPPHIVSERGQNGALSVEQREFVDSITSRKEEDKFALFLVRDCYKSKYHIDAVLRVLFFDLLSSEYRSATALGGCRRNLREYKDLGWKYCPKNSFDGHYMNKYKYNCSGYGWTDGVVQMAMPYKFMIAFENSKIKGYSTEKIFNALYAHTIPIYFGDPMITQYLNGERFIHCDTISDSQISQIRKLSKEQTVEQLLEAVKPLVMEDMKECIEKVRRVDQNETLYHQMLLRPVFVNNTYRNTVLDPEVIGEKVRYALRLHESYLMT